MTKQGKAAAAGMERYSTFLRADQLARMRQIQAAQGVPVAEQIRRALDAALGITRKGGSK